MAKCADNVNISFRDVFCNCFCRKKNNYKENSTRRPIIIFNRLPQEIDLEKLFRDKNPILQVVVNKNYDIIFSDSKGISELFNIEAKDLQGQNLKHIKSELPASIIETFISLVESILAENNYKGFLVSIDDIQYICCGFPITHEKKILSIYITKCIYNSVVYDGSFF